MTSQKGFTLIEALVAFAILAVVLVSLYEAMGTGLRSFAAASRSEEAVLIAGSRLDAIMSLKRIPELRQGKIEGTGFEWRLEVLPGPPSDPLQPLHPFHAVPVRLTISWSGNTGARKIAIDRLIVVQQRER